MLIDVSIYSRTRSAIKHRLGDGIRSDEIVYGADYGKLTDMVRESLTVYSNFATLSVAGEPILRLRPEII